MDYKKRSELPLKHLFDGINFNVYEKDVVNLSAGTPSEKLLRDCCDLFKVATEHRLVSNKKITSHILQITFNQNYIKR